MSVTSFLVENDQIVLDTNLSGGLATLIPPPTIIKVSSTAQKTTATVRKPALLGDEMTWIIPPCQYLPSGYSVPGMIQGLIVALNPSHISKKIAENMRPVLLVGSSGTKFNLMFTVSQAAKLVTPAGTVDDPVPVYTGTGYFMQLIDSKSSES